MTFQTFGNKSLEQMVSSCGAFMDRMRDGERGSWLTLLGKTGTGKTHCATWVWKWAAARFDWQRCDFVHFPIYWPKFVTDLRDGVGFSQLRDMANWPVLLLDDIGAERDETGFATEQLNMLLGCRVGKWTIITSNLTLQQIGKIDTRIADRIIREPGNRFVQVTADNFASRKKS